MTIVLTGATGFVGKHLLKRLSLSYKVIVITRESNVELIFQKNNIDLLIHCATSLSLENKDILNTNILYSSRLLALAVEYGVKFINLDTTSYYYRDNLYAKSKKIFRDILIELEFKNSLNLLIELVYGEGENPHRFLPTQISSLLKNEAINMTKGTQTRNIIHIDDLVDAVLFIIKNLENILKNRHEIFIASSDTISIKNLMSILIKLTGSKSAITYGAIDYVDNDALDSVVNNHFLRDMNWSQNVALEEGLIKKVNEMKVKCIDG